MFIKFLRICCLAFLAVACNGPSAQPNQSPPSNIGFYFWKTKLKFDKEDKALADSLGVKKLYLRYFDVDWSPTRGMAVPVSELSKEHGFETESGLVTDKMMLTSYQLIPVVFITNTVFKNEKNLDSLAAHLAKKIAAISEGITSEIYPGYGSYYEDAEAKVDDNWELTDSLAKLDRQAFLDKNNEMQIDCDWTPSTKDAYFAFLKKLQAAMPQHKFTCTVRLHQFRDREQAGIPPVQSATLMCYNVAPPSELKTANAIFDPALVEGYLKEKTYPLPLEAALPLFSWGALFHEDQFRGLASGLTEKEVKNNPLFKAAGQGRYQFTQDTVFTGVYMREGDLVRLDGPSQADLQRIAEKFSGIEAVKSISFFDWNPSIIRQYDLSNIAAQAAKNH